MKPEIRTNSGSVAAAFTGAVDPKPEKKRTKYPRITLRLSPEEDSQLRDLAKGQPVSAYVRSCVFGDHVERRKHRLHMPVADQEALARALALLGRSRIANNLNQLAHHSNTGSLLLDEDTAVQIDEAYKHVLAMRSALITALGLSEQTVTK